MHSIPGRRLIIGAVFDIPSVADLLARQHELQDQCRDRLDDDAMAACADAPALQAHLHRRELVFRLHQLAWNMSSSTPSFRSRWRCPRPTHSRVTYRFLGDKHLFFWLLVESHGAGGGLCTAVLQPLLGDRPIRYALGGGAGTLHLQRSAGSVDPRRFCLRGAARDRRDPAFLDGYSFPRFFIRILVPLIASGIGVAAFFCFMFSWVELLLARTLTSVQTKPIAAIIDAHGVGGRHGLGACWRLPAYLTIIPGALVIWFRPQLQSRARFALRSGLGRQQWNPSHGWPGRCRRRSSLSRSPARLP